MAPLSSLVCSRYSITSETTASTRRQVLTQSPLKQRHRHIVRYVLTQSPLKQRHQQHRQVFTKSPVKQRHQSCGVRYSVTSKTTASVAPSGNPRTSVPQIQRHIIAPRALNQQHQLCRQVARIRQYLPFNVINCVLKCFVTSETTASTASSGTLSPLEQRHQHFVERRSITFETINNKERKEKKIYRTPVTSRGLAVCRLKVTYQHVQPAPPRGWGSLPCLSAATDPRPVSREPRASHVTLSLLHSAPFWNPSNRTPMATVSTKSLNFTHHSLISASDNLR